MFNLRGVLLHARPLRSLTNAFASDGIDAVENLELRGLVPDGADSADATLDAFSRDPSLALHPANHGLIQPSHHDIAGCLASCGARQRNLASTRLRG